MKLKIIVVSITLCVFSLPSTSFGQKNIDLVKRNTNFAFSLYQELIKENPDENVLFSPFSISQAMAMTYAGSRNKTEEQIAQVLKFSDNQALLHNNFTQLNNKLLNNTDSISLNIANGLWMQKDYDFIEEYVDLVAKDYNAPVKTVDFKKRRSRTKTVNSINKWVTDQTDSQIQKLISPSDISKYTRLVLVNAISFYGEWDNDFDADKTRIKPFRSLLSSSDVEFMSQKNKYLYYKDDMVSAIQIPYKGEKQSMVIVLPLKDDGIKELDRSFDSYYLNSILTDMQKVTVRVSLPKFTTESSAQLKPVFEKMGMVDAFTKAADFTGMTKANDLKIDKIIHKAKIEISEKGTKAAAATAVIVIRKTAYIPDTIFNADHPFIYIIRDNETGTILFMGRLSTQK